MHIISNKWQWLRSEKLHTSTLRNAFLVIIHTVWQKNREYGPWNLLKQRVLHKHWTGFGVQLISFFSNGRGSKMQTGACHWFIVLHKLRPLLSMKATWFCFAHFYYFLQVRKHPYKIHNAALFTKVYENKKPATLKDLINWSASQSVPVLRLDFVCWMWVLINIQKATLYDWYSCMKCR